MFSDFVVVWFFLSDFFIVIFFNKHYKWIMSKPTSYKVNHITKFDLKKRQRCILTGFNEEKSYKPMMDRKYVLKYAF